MKSTRTKVNRGNVKKSGEKRAAKNTLSLAGFRALRGLFIDQLNDIYWSEQALVKSIPKMIRGSSSKELVDALTAHLAATRQHVARLEEVFSVLEERAAPVKCKPMAGLLYETEDVLQETEKGMMRDAGIIAAAQKVEHFEIATYGTLCSLARNLGEEDAALMLLESLDEEKEADEQLMNIAEDIIQEEMRRYDPEDLSAKDKKRNSKRTGKNTKPKTQKQITIN